MSLLVVAFSAAVLGGAWLASVALTRDSSIPPAPAWPEPERPPAATPALAPRAQLPDETMRQVAPAPRPPPLEPAPPPATALAPAPPPQAAFESDEDFSDERAQAVERAWALLGPEKASPLKWRKAERLFATCLAVAPGNRRCQQGIEEARRLILSTRFPPRRGYRPSPSEE
jgi:hypothetical protein